MQCKIHQSICKPKKNIDAIHHASCKKILKSIKIQNNYIPGVLTELQYSYYWYLFWVISPPSLTWRTQSRVQLELLLSEHRHSLCSRSQGWREAPWELVLPTGRNTSQRMNLSVHVCLADEPSPLSLILPWLFFCDVTLLSTQACALVDWTSDHSWNENKLFHGKNIKQLCHGTFIPWSQQAVNWKYCALGLFKKALKFKRFFWSLFSSLFTCLKTLEICNSEILQFQITSEHKAK